MRIVSWNCGGKFREKFPHILALDADIYVIQECENPAIYPSHAYSSFASNYIWTGEHNAKGLGVFAKQGICLQDNEWEKYCLRNFLSVRINNAFDIVAVWACKPYIEEYYIYQCINLPNYNCDTIIIGDFNSNAAWDKKHSYRTHSTILQQLHTIGLCSAYHRVYCEDQGKESVPTFFLYRHLDKPYHIDHCFIDPKNIKSYCVCNCTSWLNLSDHVPIILESFD